MACQPYPIGFKYGASYRRVAGGIKDRRLIGILAFTLLASLGDKVEVWMSQAFYPALSLLLFLGSMGLPIPEDIPLIAAGVVMRTHDVGATWEGVIGTGLCFVLSGDIVLYTLGRRWGKDVVNHRSVSWILTPKRFERMTAKFHRFGALMCFFGRLVMGVRAAMCLTAGATRYPFYKFIIADALGAAITVPMFVWLGYWFAGMIPTLRAYLRGVTWTIFVALLIIISVLVLIHKIRKSIPKREAPGEHEISAKKEPHVSPPQRKLPRGEAV